MTPGGRARKRTTRRANDVDDKGVIALDARAQKRTLLPVLLVLGLVLTACGSSSKSGASPTSGGSSSSGGGNVSLVAYSTPQQAYAEIISAFNKTDAGKGVKFKQSFGASGDQSRAVDSGLPADYVAFSLAPDITRLVKDGKVAANWDQNATKGMVTDSIVVLVVRKGNPKHINGWDDLTKKGVDVIVPNVFTSGGAKWDVMAAYGSQIKQGKTEAEAQQYLKDLYANISVQDSSARAALQTFTGGKGDVLLSYENDAIFAQQKGEAIDYVVPDQTILIENPVALTTTGVNDAAAKGFYNYVFTEPAQEIFAKNGYRPVVAAAASAADKPFPTPKVLFTINDFGGWSAVNAKFFDPKTSVLAAIEQGKGVATSK
jgi:sulfate transport system substrate-binding protein